LDKVKVLVAANVSEDELARMHAVSERLEVTAAYPLFRAERQRLSANGGLGEDLDNLSPELRALLADAEILFCDRLPVSVLPLAPRLKWAQLSTVGSDAVLGRTGPLSIKVTVARGTPSPNIAEHVIMSMLMLSKQAPRLMEAQKEHRWERRLPMVELTGKTVGIVGLGSIGKAVAQRVRAFEMSVLGMRRSRHLDPDVLNMVDDLFFGERLSQMLSRSDFVVVAVPLTAETKGMIGERELRAMKSTAYSINVARGDIVDEAALTKALEEGWIAGAALDVFATEPLPPDSPLWDLPGIIISPHVSGTSDRRKERLIDLFCDNLWRYLRGGALINQVDWTLGY
jgi:phosphoglycerate dehydrogenase-like enzyme